MSSVSRHLIENSAKKSKQVKDADLSRSQPPLESLKWCSKSRAPNLDKLSDPSVIEISKNIQNWSIMRRR